MGAERRADLHQLKTCLELLDQDIHLDCADGEAQVLLQRGQDLVPDRGLLGGLDFRHVQRQRRRGLAERVVVVDDEEHGVDDRCGEAAAAGVAHVPIVEVKAARPEHLRCERELPPPVGNRRPAEEALGPLVHFRRDLLGDL